MKGLDDGLIEKELLQNLDEAYKIRINNLTESIRLTYQVIGTALSNNQEMIMAKAQNLMGLFFMIKGEYEKSRKFSNDALTYFKSITDKKGMADAIFNIASTYYKTDNFHQGLLLLLQSKQLYTEIEGHGNTARVLKAIGTIYEYLGDNNKAAEIYEKCVEVSLLANEPNMESNAYNPLSGIYLKNKEFDKAMDMVKKSIAIKLKTKDERGLAFSIYGRGKVYLQLNEFDKAIDDFHQSFQLHQKMGDRLGESMALNKLGLAYYHISDFEKAIYYLTQALEIANHYNISLLIYKVNHALYLTYKKMGDWEKSLSYLEVYSTMMKASTSAQTFNLIASYDALFKLEKLESEAKAQKELYDIIEKKNIELDLFFYRVSHDLKGPITSMMGLHNLIKRENFSDGAMSYFNMYHSQFMRLHMIVMDLINLTMMKNTEENNVEIDFMKIVQDCIQSCTYHENYKKINFTYECQENLNFHSQWVIINTIFQNLIENAIKYSRKIPDSYIRIYISKEKERLKILVEDNGMGISKENHARIFNMFFRANHHVEGSGLGLYILKRAVERLRGEIELKSELGKGSTFIIYLSENACL